jgi:hypothetical protein
LEAANIKKLSFKRMIFNKKRHNPF